MSIILFQAYIVSVLFSTLAVFYVKHKMFKELKAIYSKEKVNTARDKLYDKNGLMVTICTLLLPLFNIFIVVQIFSTYDTIKEQIINQID
jgi:uncharacterized membrane protein YdjX (TVP38/TMEM64 family)